jgi:outer membrane protein
MRLLFRTNFRRRPVLLVIAATGTAMLATIGAMAEGAPPADEQATVAMGPDGKVLTPLTRDGALVSAMTHNRGVEVARFGPRIAETYAPEARAAFDPRLLATVSYGRDTRPDLTASSAASAGRQSGGTSGDVVSNAANLVSAISRLDDALDATRPAPITTKQSGASVSLTSLLPTGTQVFLTGLTELSDVHPGADLNSGDVSLGIVQPLLKGMGSKANLVALRQARNAETQSEHAFRRALLNTAQTVEESYWSLVLAGEVLKIRSFAVTLAEEQLQRNEDLLEVGKAIRGDVMSAQAERANRRAELATATGALRNQNITMARLIAQDGAPNWGVAFAPQDPADAAEVAIDGADSARLALEKRPELAEAALDLDNLALDVARERNNRLPRLDVTGSYGRYSAGRNAGAATSSWNTGRYEHYSVGLELELPLTRRAEKARLSRAKFASAQGEAALKQLEDAIVAEARQAAVDVQQTWERLNATREAVASRAEELRIAQGRFEVGKVTNLDLLQVQRDVIAAQVEDVTARAEYLQALTRLYAAEGTLLERRGISVEQYAEEN